MKRAYTFENIERERPNRFKADLVVHGINVGVVHRGHHYEPVHDAQYIAAVKGITVARGKTLGILRDDLDEWYNDERQMEEDAIWCRVERGEEV